MAPKGTGLWSMKCEFYHPSQKNCKVRIHVQFEEDENGEKTGTIVKRPNEMKCDRNHICAEPNASRFWLSKVSF